MSKTEGKGFIMEGVTIEELKSIKYMTLTKIVNLSTGECRTADPDEDRSGWRPIEYPGLRAEDVDLSKWDEYPDDTLFQQECYWIAGPCTKNDKVKDYIWRVQNGGETLT